MPCGKWVTSRPGVVLCGDRFHDETVICGECWRAALGAPLYGCHSKPRPREGQPVTGSPAYGSQEWPYANSTECRYDLRQGDPGCQECPQRGRE